MEAYDQVYNLAVFPLHKALGHRPINVIGRFANGFLIFRMFGGRLMGGYVISETRKLDSWVSKFTCSMSQSFDRIEILVPV